MNFKNTDKEIPKLNNKVWRIADCYKREGRVEEERSSDYVLVFYDELWTPAKLQLLKRTGESKHEYNWFILTSGSFYTDFEDVKYWMYMIESPIE